jgi:cytochrome o ubiquinol oxidase subunit 2
LWQPWYGVIVMLLLPVLVGGLVWAVAVAGGGNAPVLNPKGIIAKQEFDLLMFTLALSAVVVIPVFAMIGFFAWKFREDNHKAKYTPEEDGNKYLEAVWWGIPLIIIGILSVVTWVSTHQLDPYKPLDSDVKPIKVQVVALQWKWLFIYPEQNVATINELVIPAGTPVNLEISADAPMSAFWVPSLAGQKYAMNGMSSKLSLMADEPGRYFGTNTNINGEGYSEMNFQARALESRRHFDLWAEALVGLPSHATLDWAEYERIAKPSHDDPVMYYHLHDINLYNKIINKYMNMGYGATKNTDEGHGHGGEE